MNRVFQMKEDHSIAPELVRQVTRPPMLEWQSATVVRVRQETPTVKTFTLNLPNWMPHHPGQHYDVRLTTPDGCQAPRSYSIASSPEQKGEVELTIQRLSDGEVSTYLHDVLIIGDQVELRGPKGRNFVWETRMGGPLLLVAGGSGIVPLMAMLRHRNAAGSTVPARLLYSSRSREDIIYRAELERLQEDGIGLEVVHTLTRLQPEGWRGYSRRIDLDMLDEMAQPFGYDLLAYLCGPTAMVEGVASGLLTLGIPAHRIRTERFGPTGCI